MAQNYTAQVRSPGYCLNQKNCQQAEMAQLQYTISSCPGQSNPACRQLNITGSLPSGAGYDSDKETKYYVSLPQLPGAIYQNEAWGKVDPCTTSANMRGRAFKHLSPQGELQFSVRGENHQCQPTINASVNFLAQ